MILFGVTQVMLCQIPNFHKLWDLSILAATMSFTYATIGFGLGMAKLIGIVLSFSLLLFSGLQPLPQLVSYNIYGQDKEFQSLNYHGHDFIHLLY